MLEILKKLYNGNEESFYNYIIERIENNDKFSIVTVNSEHLSEENNFLFPFYISDMNVLVADGIAVKTLTNLKKINKVSKITGVDISRFLLNYADENGLSVGTLGACEESVAYFKEYVNFNFPNIHKITSINGFVENKDEVLQKFATERTDIILVALGVPFQEDLIERNIHFFESAVLVGVGGALDVLGGFKKRAPKVFLITNTEWLYRIFSEPKRISGFIKSNVKLFFYIFVKKNKLL